MSKIVDIQDALNTLIETTLPLYVQLPDAYEPEDNAVIDLDKGYATGFGPGDNNQDNFCKGDIRVIRNFAIILSNAYVSNLDADYRVSVEQSLMDDHTELLKAIECNPTLNQNCINTEYVADTGIEYLTTDRKQFITITTNITTDYMEGV